MSDDARAFAGPSAVGRYWIAHSEGFAVESPGGRAVGTVEAVAVDPQTEEPMLVLERSAVLGPRRGVIPAARVAVVMPWSERLVLAKAPRHDTATTIARPAVPVARSRRRVDTSEVAAVARRYLSAAAWATARGTVVAVGFAIAVLLDAALLAARVGRVVWRALVPAAAWARSAAPVVASETRTRATPGVLLLRRMGVRGGRLAVRAFVVMRDDLRRPAVRR
jgi:hypothetical protein